MSPTIEKKTKSLNINTWETKSLADLVEIINGGTPKTSVREYWNGDIQWLSITDFKNSFRFVRNTEKKITELGLKNSATNILKKGMLILSARGTVGALAQVASEMAFNQSCYGLNGEGISNDFLYYALSYKIQALKNNAHGATFDTITRDTLSSIFIDYPVNQKEQQRIAEILSKWDQAIEKLESLIELKEKYFKHILGELINPKQKSNFKKVKLKELISSISSGVSVNSDSRPINNENDKGILKTSCLTGCEFNPKENKVILRTEINRARLNPKKDSILVSRMNTPVLVGENAYVDSDYSNLFIPDRIWQLEINKTIANAKFLSYILSSPKMRTMISDCATGTSNSMKNISQEVFLSLSINIPNLAAQQKISDYLNAIKQEKNHLISINNVIKNQKQGLMQKLLTGKVRVKV